MYLQKHNPESTSHHFRYLHPTPNHNPLSSSCESLLKPCLLLFPNLSHINTRANVSVKHESVVSWPFSFKTLKWLHSSPQNTGDSLSNGPKDLCGCLLSSFSSSPLLYSTGTMVSLLFLEHARDACLSDFARFPLPGMLFPSPCQ